MVNARREYRFESCPDDKNMAHQVDAYGSLDERYDLYIDNM